MYQKSFGNISSPILCLEKTLDLHIFIDAGGKAGRQRVWGGLAVIGDHNLTWLDQCVDSLIQENGGAELKGRVLDTSKINDIEKNVAEENKSICFWSNWFPNSGTSTSVELADFLEKKLSEIQANKYHLEKEPIQAWNDSKSSYFAGLKPINKHKILSIIAHIRWIMEEIKINKIGPQLKSATITIDKENFPNEEKCGLLLKSFIAAFLQNAGMAYTLTGNVIKETAREGAVTIEVSGESKTCKGIMLVDILLQPVLRIVEPIPEKA